MLEKLVEIGAQMVARFKELPALESIVIGLSVIFFAIIVTGISIIWKQWRADVKMYAQERKERDLALQALNENHFKRLEVVVKDFSTAMGKTAENNGKIAQTLVLLEHHVQTGNEVVRTLNNTFTQVLIQKAI